MFIPGRAGPTFLSRIVRKRAHELTAIVGPTHGIHFFPLRLLRLFRLFSFPRSSGARSRNTHDIRAIARTSSVIDRSLDSDHLGGISLLSRESPLTAHGSGFLRVSRAKDSSKAKVIRQVGNWNIGLSELFALAGRVRCLHQL